MVSPAEAEIKARVLVSIWLYGFVHKLNITARVNQLVIMPCYMPLL